MNNFSKEELQELKRCCNWVINCRDTNYTSVTYILTEKLQSMIDNYRDPKCNHVIDKEVKACSLCGLPSHSIPCVGGWL